MRCFQIIIFCLGLGVSSCQAQRLHNKHDACSLEYDSLLKSKVYTWVDRMPKYSTGEVGVIKFFRENFHYPEQQSYYQGTINLVFVVMGNGEIKGGRIYNKSISELTLVDKEALRVLQNMPRWEAGKCEERKVPVRVSLPIKF